ncbi:UPF0187-domain-containing protein [Bimuria novae-zelandiae CBS 107.79]|uniref:UPF0187-domain-containing protein n=1 Tax=Bimuria novae-zelandiae CBS 107.79 TaxID=1447943 RepID=A0A6A5V8J3_9PLEO|nr:UPF0187-domain-containing protein [Bimuria novae-zelandiae CBS 107.79]
MVSQRPSFHMVDGRTRISTSEESLISQKRKTPTFVGPRGLDRHSKWPMLFRIHGSCLPELVIPLLFVAAWSTGICVISKHVRDLGVKSTLLTVLGFIIALALSFRSSTAYERYMEGRRAWTSLTMVSQNLARNIWINADEREGSAKDDLLAKVTALNLIVAYAQALKHRLRFEPYTHYRDLHHLTQHLDTFANRATALEPHPDEAPLGFWQSWGEYLAIPMTLSNPRKLLKRAQYPLGNLPLEILNHLTVYIHSIIAGGCFKANIYQTQALNAVMTLNDIQATTDRILNTPLPLAYAIAISQLTWVYILILPFQLYETLGMLAIPGTIFAAYMILGFASIGRELENPFGHDVNDLPLDDFCASLAVDIDIIAATAPQDADAWVKSERNAVMHPLSQSGWEVWSESGVEEIRDALKRRSVVSQRGLMPGLRKGEGFGEV